MCPSSDRSRFSPIEINEPMGRIWTFSIDDFWNVRSRSRCCDRSHARIVSRQDASISIISSYGQMYFFRIAKSFIILGINRNRRILPIGVTKTVLKALTTGRGLCEKLSDNAIATIERRMLTFKQGWKLFSCGHGQALGKIYKLSLFIYFLGGQSFTAKFALWPKSAHGLKLKSFRTRVFHAEPSTGV